jgi:chromosome segregation ATPase
MAGKTIKGLTVEIGGDTTKLGKALESVNKTSRDLTSELGQINRLLKMDPGNADLLAQKQKVLAEAVSNTASKLEILEEAEKQVQEQFKRGEVSEEQVRALQREIVATTAKLRGYENAARETAEAVDRLGDNSDGAAAELDDVADSADKADDASRDLGSSLDGALAKGFTTVTALAAAASAAIVGCVEASHEYRTAMGKLDTAFTTSNLSSEAAKDTYKELQSILGETDQAVEAASHLAKLASNENELTQLTTALTGVYATFGASLPIEALAESANESARTGEIAGNLADALNWAAEEGETFGVAMKEATEENEAWNEAVEEATKAEDYFNLALQECNSEQERQQLITQTLTKLYGKAADQYKKTNKAVIESNKANEEWNETLAELGDDMTPVVTEVKKFGAELLKNAKEPLQEVGGFLTGTVLPALTSLARWISNNIPLIKAGLVGVTAAIVTYKVATLAAEIAQKGFKAALLATEVAQKALNLAMAATPWGLAAVAIVGVVAAVASLGTSITATAEDVNILTAEEKELMAAADETAQSFREQEAALAQSTSDIMSQMGHVQSLADELLSLADASGKVKETDEARAQFILNELNSALGTEYEMTGGVIQNYKDLKSSIDDVIQSKTANALLEANNQAYIDAIQAEDQAIANLVLKEQDYLSQKESGTKKITDWEAQIEELTKKRINGVGILTSSEMSALSSQINNLAAKVNAEKQLIADKEKAYNDSLVNYGKYHETIVNYEDAQKAALEGNYDTTVEILRNKGQVFSKYADDVDADTKRSVDSLYREAINAGLEADRTKKNFEKGVAGYTEEMVTEAEKGYSAALAKWAEAYNAANKVGTDLGGGLTSGMENTIPKLKERAARMVNSIIETMRKTADSHSPSRKMISFGEDMGAGAEIGIENTTPDLLRTARAQVNNLMAAYQDEGVDAGQAVARSVSDRSLARSNANLQGLFAGSSAKLDQILQAIQAGQVILLDGDRLVGGTVDRMDAGFGQRRLLVERGAL